MLRSVAAMEAASSRSRSWISQFPGSYRSRAWLSWSYSQSRTRRIGPRTSDLQDFITSRADTSARQSRQADTRVRKGRAGGGPLNPAQSSLERSKRSKKYSALLFGVCERASRFVPAFHTRALFYRVRLRLRKPHDRKRLLIVAMTTGNDYSAQGITRSGSLSPRASDEISCMRWRGCIRADSADENRCSPRKARVKGRGKAEERNSGFPAMESLPDRGESSGSHRVDRTILRSQSWIHLESIQPRRARVKGRRDSGATKTSPMERFLSLCLRLPDGEKRTGTCRADKTDSNLSRWWSLSFNPARSDAFSQKRSSSRASDASDENSRTRGQRSERNSARTYTRGCVRVSCVSLGAFTTRPRAIDFSDINAFDLARNVGRPT